MIGWAILAIAAVVAALLLYLHPLDRYGRRQRSDRERRDREWWGRGR